MPAQTKNASPKPTEPRIVHTFKDPTDRALEFTREVAKKAPDNATWLAFRAEQMKTPAGPTEVVGVVLQFHKDAERKLIKTTVYVPGKSADLRAEEVKTVETGETGETGETVVMGLSPATLALAVCTLLEVPLDELVERCEFGGIGDAKNLHNGKASRTVYLVHRNRCDACGLISQGKADLYSSGVTLFGHKIRLCAGSACERSAALVVCGATFQCGVISSKRTVKVFHVDGTAFLVDGDYQHEAAAAGDEGSSDDEPIMPAKRPVPNAKKPAEAGAAQAAQAEDRRAEKPVAVEAEKPAVVEAEAVEAEADRSEEVEGLSMGMDLLEAVPVVAKSKRDDAPHSEPTKKAKRQRPSVEPEQEQEQEQSWTFGAPQLSSCYADLLGSLGADHFSKAICIISRHLLGGPQMPL